MSLETTLHSSPSAESLRGLCGGRVHLPGDDGYDASRSPWNLAIDQRPAAVAVPHTAEEVAQVVRAAATAGLHVAPQSSGHNPGPLVDHGLAGTVLLRLHEMTGVTVGPGAGTVRVVGGTLWQDVVAALAPHGRAVMHGSSPDVAVAGYTLGGGLSWYARRHGLAADSVTALEVVTADGRLVRADAERESELFWALRGGGGNLGAVTAIELRTLPYADSYAGMLLWDRERAPEVLRAWSEWTRELPESVTTSIRLMSFPPLPDLPPFLSGRQLVVIDGAVLEADDRAAELLAPLRALAPEMDTFGRIPAAALPQIHMDPPQPTPAVSGHAMLAGVSEEALAALLAEVGPGHHDSTAVRGDPAPRWRPGAAGRRRWRAGPAARPLPAVRCGDRAVPGGRGGRPGGGGPAGRGDAAVVDRPALPQLHRDRGGHRARRTTRATTRGCAGCGPRSTRPGCSGPTTGCPDPPPHRVVRISGCQRSRSCGRPGAHGRLTDGSPAPASSAPRPGRRRTPGRPAAATSRRHGPPRRPPPRAPGRR